MTRFLSKSCPSAASTGRKLWESGGLRPGGKRPELGACPAPTGAPDRTRPVHTAPETGSLRLVQSLTMAFGVLGVDRADNQITRVHLRNNHRTKFRRCLRIPMVCPAIWNLSDDNRPRFHARRLR